jgi:hypothetical protein
MESVIRDLKYIFDHSHILWDYCYYESFFHKIYIFNLNHLLVKNTRGKGYSPNPKHACRRVRVDMHFITQRNGISRWLKDHVVHPFYDRHIDKMYLEELEEKIRMIYSCSFDSNSRLSTINELMILKRIMEMAGFRV